MPEANNFEPSDFKTFLRRYSNPSKEHNEINQVLDKLDQEMLSRARQDKEKTHPKDVLLDIVKVGSITKKFTQRWRMHAIGAMRNAASMPATDEQWSRAILDILPFVTSDGQPLEEPYTFGASDKAEIRNSAGGTNTAGWKSEYFYWPMSGRGGSDTTAEFFEALWDHLAGPSAEDLQRPGAGQPLDRVLEVSNVPTPITWLDLIKRMPQYKNIVQKHEEDEYADQAATEAGSADDPNAGEGAEEEIWIDNLKDVLAERRFQEQCYLIEHFKEICSYNHCTSYWSTPPKKKKHKQEETKLKTTKGGVITSREVSSKEDYYARGNFGFVCLNPDPHRIIHRLTTRKSMTALSNLMPHQVARLEPRVRFFKLAYPTKTSHDSGTPVEKEIVFASHNDPNTIESMLSNRKGRHDGVGIKRFTWTNLGTSDADVNIVCKLELYFRNLEDLDAVYDDGRANPRSRYGSFMDLIIYGPAREKINKDPFRHGALEWDPDHMELKVALGWVAPKDNEMVGEDLKEFIEHSGTYLRLILLQHRFNFKEDGSGTLTLEFQGWAESRERTVKADILTMTRPMLKRLNWLEKQKEKSYRKHQEAQRQIEENEAEKRRQSERGGGNWQSDVVDVTDEWWDQASEAINRAAGNESYQPTTAKGKAQKAKFELEEQEKRLEEFNQQIQVAKYERLVSRVTRSNRLFYIDVNRKEIGNIQERQLTRKQMAMARVGSEKKSKKAPDIPKTDFKREMIKRQTDDFVAKKGMDLLYSSAKKGDDAEFLSEEQLIDFSQPKGKDVLRLNYFYLGDLIWHAMDMAVMSVDPKTKNIRYLLGSMTFIDSATKKPYAVNIADIPISLNLFMVWFMNRVVKTRKDSYMLKDFIRDVVNDLVLNALSSECFAEYPSRPRFNMLRISSPGTGRNYKKDRVPKTASGRINSVRKITPPGKANLSSIKTKRMFFYNYLFIHSALPSQMTGNRARDEQNGIYHFYVGADRGIMQGITFDKVDQPGVREARTTMEGVGAIAAQLRHQYNVKITCFGNTIFRPGMYVFVNPRVTGGRANAKRSLTFKLGLGGYVFITKVENVVEAGKFTTILYGINDGLLPAGVKSPDKNKLPGAAACSDKIKNIRDLWIGKDPGIEP